MPRRTYHSFVVGTISRRSAGRHRGYRCSSRGSLPRLTSVSFLPVAIDAIRDDVLALSAEDLAEFAAALLDSLGARSPTPTRTRWIAPGPPNSNAVQRRLTPGIPADEALVKVRQSLVE